MQMTDHSPHTVITHVIKTSYWIAIESWTFNDKFYMQRFNHSLVFLSVIETLQIKILLSTIIAQHPIAMNIAEHGT